MAVTARLVTLTHSGMDEDTAVACYSVGSENTQESGEELS